MTRDDPPGPPGSTLFHFKIFPTNCKPYVFLAWVGAFLQSGVAFSAAPVYLQRIDPGRPTPCAARPGRMDGWNVADEETRGKVRGKNPLVGLAAAWLIPGAGHYYLSLKGKAVYYFVLINTTFLLGLFLSDFCSVNLDRFFWHYLGEILYGGGTLIAQALTAERKIGEFNRFLDYGTLMTTVAGLLNLVVMVDYFETWARKR